MNTTYYAQELQTLPTEMALIPKTSMKPFGNTDGYIKQNITFHLESQSSTGFNYMTFCFTVMPR